MNTSRPLWLDPLRVSILILFLSTVSYTDCPPPLEQSFCRCFPEELEGDNLPKDLVCSSPDKDNNDTFDGLFSSEKWIALESVEISEGFTAWSDLLRLSLPKLRLLNISGPCHNYCPRLTERSAATLTTLHLRNGALDSLQEWEQTWGTLTNLQVLSISGNKVSSLNLGPLLGAANSLRSINLESNLALKTIGFSPPAGFRTQQFHHLENFSIRNNPFLRVLCPWTLLRAPSLQHLDLRGNPSLRLDAILMNPELLGRNGLTSLQMGGGTSFKECPCEIISSSMPDAPCYDSDGVLHPSMMDFVHDGGDNVTCHHLKGVSGDNDSSGGHHIKAFVHQDLKLDCDHGTRTAWITPMRSVRVNAKGNEDDIVTCDSCPEMFEEHCVSQDDQLILSSMGNANSYERIRTNSEGSLFISGLRSVDRGIYTCLSWSPFAVAAAKNNTLNAIRQMVFKVELDTAFRQDLYRISLIYGFSVAGGFLLLTLLIKLIYYLLLNYGCCLFCCCCKNRLPPKAKRLKVALDSIEAYRIQQLDKLRENYHQQSDWIRQNCALQMERVRENYNSQIQSLKDIKQYGSAHLTAVRDQYYDQMQRIRDYSTSQLERVNENYIFQRQKLRKFTAHNYLKMQETRKYTRKTLNKVMDNLPALYLDLTTCRQGLGQRQPSLEWEVEGDDDGCVEKCVRRSTDSLYFTPSASPPEIITRRIPDQHLYDELRFGVKSKNFKKTTSRSFSNFLPQWWLGTAGSPLRSSNAGASGEPRLHQAVIEHEMRGSDDYLHVNHQLDEDATPNHQHYNKSLSDAIIENSSSNKRNGSLSPTVALSHHDGAVQGRAKRSSF